MSPERGVRHVAVRGAGIVNLAYRRDGSQITAIREDGEILVSDAAPARVLRSSKSVQVTENRAEVRRRTLAQPRWGPRRRLDAHEPVKLRATTDGREIATLDGLGGFSVAFSPDGRRVTANDGRETRVVICDSASGQRLLTCDPYDEVPQEPVALDFSPDGTRLVAVMPDGKLAVWDAATGRHLVPVTLPGQPTGSGRGGVALSRDNSRIIVPVKAPDAPAGQGAVVVLNARNGAERAKHRHRDRHGGGVQRRRAALVLRRRGPGQWRGQGMGPGFGPRDARLPRAGRADLLPGTRPRRFAAWPRATPAGS